MFKPIILIPRTTASSEFDEGGIEVFKTVLPRSAPLKNYSENNFQNSHYVPSLAEMCIRALYQFPDQIHDVPRMRYTPPINDTSYDLLRALIPSYSSTNPYAIQWHQVDPRLWVTIVQLYDNLPPVFQVLPLALSDPHLKHLQQVKSTPSFTLVTVLELAKSKNLTDDTVDNLRSLHCLYALDASKTALTSTGISRLVAKGFYKAHHNLRILRLRDCRDMKANVYPLLEKFPLLTVCDLTGTQCTPLPQSSSFRPAPSSMISLYFPNIFTETVFCLEQLCGRPVPYTLHVATLHSSTRNHKLDAEDHPLFRYGRAGTSLRHSSESDSLGHTLSQTIAWSQYSRAEETDIQSLVAKSEHQFEASQQAAYSFYRLDTSLPKPRQKRSTNDSEDHFLMLYREPPPNSVLAEPLDIPVKRHRPQTTLAVVDSSKKQEFQRNIGQLMRKRKAAKPAADTPSNALPATKARANPFRRKPPSTVSSSAVPSNSGQTTCKVHQS